MEQQDGNLGERRHLCLVDLDNSRTRDPMFVELNQLDHQTLYALLENYNEIWFIQCDKSFSNAM